jgi:hypothetical protein
VARPLHTSARLHVISGTRRSRSYRAIEVIPAPRVAPSEIGRTACLIAAFSTRRIAGTCGSTHYALRLKQFDSAL